jgi:hypothetical protein
VFRRRTAGYDSRDDLEDIMRKLMSMDEKLSELLRHFAEEEDDDEEQD